MNVANHDTLNLGDSNSGDFNFGDLDLISSTEVIEPM